MGGATSQYPDETQESRTTRERDGVSGPLGAPHAGPYHRTSDSRIARNASSGRARGPRPTSPSSSASGLFSGLLVALGLLLLFISGFLSLLWRAIRWLAPRLLRTVAWLARGLYLIIAAGVALVASRSTGRASATGRATARSRAAVAPRDRKSSGRPTSLARPARTRARRAGPAFDPLRLGLSAAAVLLITLITVLASQPAETAVASASASRAEPPVATPARASSRALAATATAAPTDRVAVAAAPTSSCPALPANSPRLGAVIDAEISKHAGHYGVAVLNLGANEAYLLNADERFPAGSVYKLTILYEAWRRVQLGTLSPETKITITKADALEAEPRGGVPVGAEVTVREALKSMITISSNNAAHAMLRTLGRDAVNRSARDLGLRDTLLPTPVRPTGVSDDDGGEVAVSSPRDMLCFMNLLARDRLLAPAQNVEMRAVLLQQKIDDRLPALLPDDARVAHKTGEIAGVRNDVGIVYTPEATWAIAVFSRDADEGEATAVIARLSKRIHDYFVGPLEQSGAR